MPHTLKVKDINDIDVEIPMETIIAVAKDYTDGFKVGFSRAYERASTKSTLITIAFTSVLSLGTVAILEHASYRKEKLKQNTADSE